MVPFFLIIGGDSRFQPVRPDGDNLLNRSISMTADDFREIALSFDGAEEGGHMGSPDFRVGGRIFATLASADQGYGNLMLNPEHQGLFLEDYPDDFLPISGGWGRMGMTHVRLDSVTDEILTEALKTAWRLRMEKNKGR